MKWPSVSFTITQILYSSPDAPAVPEPLELLLEELPQPASIPTHIALASAMLMNLFFIVMILPSLSSLCGILTVFHQHRLRSVDERKCLACGGSRDMAAVFSMKMHKAKTAFP